MARRTGKEGLHPRIIPDKRRKIEQQVYLELTLEDYIPTICPKTEEEWEDTLPGTGGSTLGIDLGVAYGDSDWEDTMPFPLDRVKR